MTTLGDPNMIIYPEGIFQFGENYVYLKAKFSIISLSHVLLFGLYPPHQGSCADPLSLHTQVGLPSLALPSTYGTN